MAKRQVKTLPHSKRVFDEGDKRGIKRTLLFVYEKLNLML
jgi:hypothetical protein